VAVRTTWRDDLYVILAAFDANANSVTLKAIINPLVVWLWVGFITLVFGTIVAALPDPREARVAVRARVQELLARAEV
jgi:cytochrome c-type biogenesis protein CcmF